MNHKNLLIINLLMSKFCSYYARLFRCYLFLLLSLLSSEISIFRLSSECQISTTKWNLFRSVLHMILASIKVNNLAKIHTTKLFSLIWYLLNETKKKVVRCPFKKLLNLFAEYYVWALSWKFFFSSFVTVGIKSWFSNWLWGAKSK